MLNEIKNKCYQLAAKQAKLGVENVDVTDFCNWFETVPDEFRAFVGECYIIFQNLCSGRVGTEDARKEYNELIKKQKTKQERC